LFLGVLYDLYGKFHPTAGAPTANEQLLVKLPARGRARGVENDSDVSTTSPLVCQARGVGFDSEPNIS
jgi:hypothetical protein